MNMAANIIFCEVDIGNIGLMNQSKVCVNLGVIESRRRLSLYPEHPGQEIQKTL